MMKKSARCAFNTEKFSVCVDISRRTSRVYVAGWRAREGRKEMNRNTDEDDDIERCWSPVKPVIKVESVAVLSTPHRNARRPPCFAAAWQCPRADGLVCHIECQPARSWVQRRPVEGLRACHGALCAPVAQDISLSPKIIGTMSR